MATLTKNICQGQLHGMFFSNMPTHHCKEVRQYSNSAGSPSNFLAARLPGRACKCSRQRGRLESPPSGRTVRTCKSKNPARMSKVTRTYLSNRHTLLASWGMKIPRPFGNHIMLKNGPSHLQARNPFRKNDWLQERWRPHGMTTQRGHRRKEMTLTLPRQCQSFCSH